MANHTKPIPVGVTVRTIEPPPVETEVEVFDFTVHVSVMGELTKLAYYLLRRKAKMAKRGLGDENLLPDGKTMTRAEIEAILGTTIEQARIDSRCCGQ
jgi:hypothetical protein